MNEDMFNTGKTMACADVAMAADARSWRAQAIRDLKACQSDTDTETAHSRADTVLMELLTRLGYQDVVLEYEKVGKWYA